MRTWRRVVGVAAAVLMLGAALASAQGSGRIRGRVTDKDGAALAGVSVAIGGLTKATVTTNNGDFYFADVPPGTYDLTFALGDFNETQAGVAVKAGETTRLEKSVPWQVSFAQSITVFSASRRTERVVDAPAAVTVVTQEDIARESTPGQAPKMLETATGVDFTQSGLYDFNFNARGFNSSLNRRILTLIDGRDPSVPFLGAMEWAALSFPVDEYASIELVRGPGAALYGANAFNGVLNMTTKQPRYSEGGKLTLTGGELATGRADFRWGGDIGGNWFYKLTGGYQKSDDFTRARNVVPDYTSFCASASQTNCLRREAVPLARKEVKIGFGGLRLDRYFAGGEALTFEAGTADLDGPTFVTGIGRVQVTDTKRPWGRINFNTAHWNVLTYYDTRDAKNQLALSSGAELFEKSSNLHGEIQGNTGFANERGRIIGGVSFHQQKVDTANPAGQQTLMRFGKRDEHQEAGFGQLEYDLASNVKAVVSGRYDKSTLHDSQFSPKASLVWGIHGNHTLRVTYNEAFQVPNYSEFFLRVPAGAPITAFAPLEQAIGVPLGLRSIPITAYGNPALGVEKIKSYEIGYSGIFGSKLFVTLDYYQNKTQNFVTDLLPGVNTEFAPYAPPAALPASVRTLILNTLKGGLGANFAGLTSINGQPTLVFSYANAGKVDVQGAEFSFNYYLTDSWVLDGNYSWFDFKIKETNGIPASQLLPNAPDGKYNLGLSFRQPRWDVTVKVRHVQGFSWAAGVFVGDVPAYDVINLNANVKLSDHFGLGLAVSNLGDKKHFESFGGDLLGRRALGSLSITW